MSGLTLLLLLAVPPATVGVELPPVPPPADAVVLFDGQNADAWRRSSRDEAAGWEVADGELRTNGSGSIDTRQAFRDFQLHLQFAVGTQSGGNSGIYLLGRYEIQILNSYGKRPGKGECGAIYQHTAPPVNASLEAGRWQTFDIIFRAPRFDAAGKQTEPARISVIHNGVWLHHEVPVAEGTGSAKGRALVPEGPIQLQDHGAPVRFRNIWVRPLAEN